MAKMDQFIKSRPNLVHIRSFGSFSLYCSLGNADRVRVFVVKISARSALKRNVSHPTLFMAHVLHSKTRVRSTGTRQLLF